MTALFVFGFANNWRWEMLPLLTKILILLTIKILPLAIVAGNFYLYWRNKYLPVALISLAVIVAEIGVIYIVSQLQVTF